MLKRTRIIATLALCALLPATMAPTGGLPSRPTFQTVTATATASGTTSTATLRSNIPSLQWNESDGAANNRWWEIAASGEGLYFSAYDDSHSSGTDFIAIQRTGTTIDSVQIVNPLVSASAAQLRFTTPAGAANNKHTLLRNGVAGDFAISFATDATPDTAATNPILISRSGTTATSIELNASVVNIRSQQYHRIERAVVNGTTGACSNASAGISCARTATGTYNVQFSPQFTSAPVCVSTPGANLRTVVGSPPTTAQYLFNAWSSTAATLLDTEVQVMCAGYY